MLKICTRSFAHCNQTHPPYVARRRALLPIRVGRAVALLSVAALLLSFTPARVSAGGGSSATSLSGYITGDLYLYEPNSQPPLDVTQTYKTYGYVFDSSGNPLYIQINNPNVLDLHGDVIGFVEQ
jgi:hypothetical protein